MKRLVAVLILLSGIAAALPAQQGRSATPAKAPPARNAKKTCQLSLDSARTLNRQSLGNSTTNFLGGGVWLSCIGRETRLISDSLIDYDAFTIVTALGHVKYHDEKYDITADTLNRYQNPERILLRGNVHVLDRKTGSTVEGPAVDYFRGPPATPDSDRVVAFNRPTATLQVQRTAKDKTPPSPYILIADRMTGWGSNQIMAYGTVTIARDSLRASGDSLNYQTGKNRVSRIYGSLAQVERQGSDSVRVHGREIAMGFGDDEKLTSVRSFGEALLVRSEATVTGDTVVVGLKGDEVTSIFAWDRKQRAHLHRENYDAYGDSLAIESRDGHLHELQLFENGMVFQPMDSVAQAHPADSASAGDRDWLSGRQVRVSFRQVDSSGTALTMVDRLVARRGDGKAPSCSFFSNAPAPVKGQAVASRPTITYTCADIITVRMKSGLAREVDDVIFTGSVNGYQFDPVTATATSTTTTSRP